MKARILTLSAAIFSLSLFFTSCQKNSSDTATDYTSETATHSDDQSRFSNESDAVSNDANAILETTPGFGRVDGVQSIICDADIVVDTVSNPRTITITYNGNNCQGTRTRTGKVIIAMAQGVR